MHGHYTLGLYIYLTEANIIHYKANDTHTRQNTSKHTCKHLCLPRRFICLNYILVNFNFEQEIFHKNKSQKYPLNTVSEIFKDLK